MDAQRSIPRCQRWGLTVQGVSIDTRSQEQAFWISLARNEMVASLFDEPGVQLSMTQRPVRNAKLKFFVRSSPVFMRQAPQCRVGTTGASGRRLK